MWFSTWGKCGKPHLQSEKQSESEYRARKREENDDRSDLESFVRI